MIDGFILRVALAGVGVALAAGPLGCFVVWRRMAYFGDAIAHAAILGVALSLLTALPMPAGVLAVAAAVGAGVALLTGRGLAADTLLGVAAHGGLALGMVALALTGTGGISPEAYLFGDILTVDNGDLAVIWGGALVVLGVLAWRWPALLLATLSPDLARAEGGDPRRERLVLTLLIALLVAVAIKVVGALLITAMLIIPAAAARGWSRTPEGMARGAALAGVTAALAGFGVSLMRDVPTGPAIVVAATVLFAASRMVQR